MSGEPLNLARTEPPAQQPSKGPSAIERLSDLVASLIPRIQLLERQPLARDGRDGLIGRDGKDGLDGKPGIDGKPGEPGKDGRAGADGKPGTDGAPGRDGIDGKDGRDGIDGQDGKPGIDGKAGEPGRDGRDGRGITGAAITDGKLVLTFSDGSDAVVGNVVGPAGKDGSAGKDGIDGAPGDTGKPGANGKDGPIGPQGRAGRDGKDGAPGDAVALELSEPYAADIRDLKDVQQLVLRDLTINGTTYQVLCRS